MNIFRTQPEFIDMDPRIHRPKEYGYVVDPEFMLTRHEAMLPPDLIKEKRVVDLGSCLAATGAWCLSNGASFYKGIEIDDVFVKNSSICLNKYYSTESWSITRNSIEDFLGNNEEKYDILIASGVMHGSGDPLKILSLFAGIADYIVIESIQTNTIFDQEILSADTISTLKNDPNIESFLESASYISVGPRAMSTSNKKTIEFSGLSPSMGAIIYVMKALGFDSNNQPYLKLKDLVPDVYAPDSRFVIHFKKNEHTASRKFGLNNAFSDSNNILDEHTWKS
ncbi:hypothetical protein JV46_04980 [Solemya velum gill symbiont]|uniref:Methyltransferase domain-containing protein n=2 Tax=Solemya velum gill symbiont TaxID=2340 RepID=A0A0B0H8R9_SOVGS|nr:hypothetical protein JV46_04980 [Solemya velum gill symbiont]